MSDAHPPQDRLEGLIHKLLPSVGVQFVRRTVCISDNLKGIRDGLRLDVFGGCSPRLARELVNNNQNVFMP